MNILKIYKWVPVLLMAWVFFSCKQPEEELDFSLAYEIIDSLILEEKLEEFVPIKATLLSEKMVQIAQSFLGAPYVSKSLEIEGEEKLVINLSGFDCTTFVESCLAMAITSESKHPSFNEYARNLKRIRYRNGNIDGYASRLHYFSDWIINNEQKQIIRVVSKEIGGIPYNNAVGFMSGHPGAYKQLAANSSLVKIIEQQEKTISEYQLNYLPKDVIVDYENELNEGDIVGITTDIGGLDIIHTGILVKKGERIHLLHASSDFKQVVISEKPLVDYLAGNKIQTGIMILKLQ